MSEPPVLIGRDRELAWLGEWIHDVVSGSGRAALIEGEPGIGKSSIVRAVASIADGRGCRVYQAAADELSQALPLRPLLDAFQSCEAADEPRLATILRLLRGDLPGSAAPVVSASEQMLTLVAELCSAAPTVLIIDDLQTADLATLSVWRWLAQSANRAPLLLIGTLRPTPRSAELLALRRVVGAAGTIYLDRLSDTAVAELITKIVGEKPTKRLLQLAEGAAGNPLYLTELMNTLVCATRTTVTERCVADAINGPVPDSLIGAIKARLAFLPQNAQQMLQAAALLGVEFLPSDLALVLDKRIAELVPVIDEARTAGVLKEARERLVFRHPLIREAFYDDIPPCVRAAWHRDAAVALAKAGVSVIRVARQLLRVTSFPGGGLLDESLLNWMIDAAPALVAQAPQAAIELLRQACDQSRLTSQRGGVLSSRLAEAQYRAGESSAGAHTALRAMRVVTDPDLLVDLHWTLYQCRSVMGQSDESLRTLARALASPRISGRHQARLLVLTARAHRDLGEVTQAGRVADEALTKAEAVGDGWAIGWSLHVATIVSTMRGDAAAALPLFNRALDVVGDDNELTDLGLLLRINLAVALGDLDRYADAIEAAEQARELADHVGSLVRLAQAQTALGELLFEVGRWDDAEAEVEAIPDEFKDPGATCCDRGISALIAFHRGNRDVARRHLNQAQSSAVRLGNRVIASLTLAQSLDHEITGALTEALAVLVARMASDAEELDEMEDLLPEAVRLAMCTDMVDAATRVVAQAAKLAEKSQVPHRLAADAYCRGLLKNDPLLLLDAAALYEEAHRPLLRAKALEAAAIGFVDRGDKGSARNAFTDADDLYDRLGAGWDVARLRARMRTYDIRLGSRAKHRRAQAGWGSLTPTETRIAKLVAEGLANRVIAEQLFLSTRTVDTHVSHILAKLNVRSRVEIARKAAMQGQ